MSDDPKPLAVPNQLSERKFALLDAMTPNPTPIKPASNTGQTWVPKYPLPLKAEDAPQWMPMLHGATILTGKPSAGKSWLAIGAGMEAAKCGWDVAYISAEMDPSEVYQRAAAYGEGEIPENFGVHVANYGIEFTTFVRYVCELVGTNNLLVIIDSVSSLVDQMQTEIASEDIYSIGPLKRLMMWVMNAVRASRGTVSFLLLSEANAQGETKGRFGDHKANVVLNMDSDADVPMRKHIKIIKAWSGQIGSLGTYELDWKTARFFRVEEI